jgi:hypothetical protein
MLAETEIATRVAVVVVPEETEHPEQRSLRDEAEPVAPALLAA